MWIKIILLVNSLGVSMHFVEQFSFKISFLLVCTNVLSKYLNEIVFKQK